MDGQRPPLAPESGPAPARLVPHPAPGLEIRLAEGNSGRARVAGPDGRFFEVSAETARVLRWIDGRRSVAEIAAALAAEAGAAVDPDALAAAIRGSLVPAGLASFGDAPAVEAPGSRAEAGRGWRWTLLTADQADRFAGALAPLFRPAVGAPLLLAAAAAHGVFYVRDLPALLAGRFLLEPGWLAALAIVALSFVLHELGHAAALRAAGERPGAIGLGLAGPAPAFFADVSRAWLLPRGARVAVDAGGVAVQFALAGLALALHSAGGPALAARAGLLLDLAVLCNLSPLPRLDGYWLFADLAGVRDLWERVGARKLGRGRTAATPLPRATHALYLLAAFAHLALMAALAAWLAARFAAEARGGP